MPGDRSPATKQAARHAGAALHTFARIFPIGKPRDQLLHGLVLHLSCRPSLVLAAYRIIVRRHNIPRHFRICGDSRQRWRRL